MREPAVFVWDGKETVLFQREPPPEWRAYRKVARVVITVATREGNQYFNGINGEWIQWGQGEWAFVGFDTEGIIRRMPLKARQQVGQWLAERYRDAYRNSPQQQELWRFPLPPEERESGTP